MDTDQPNPGETSVRASFVVRIWFDRTPTSAGVVRGSIQQVGRQALRYFASFESMREIIGEMVAGESSAANLRQDRRTTAS